jgi:hypothetical protein
MEVSGVVFILILSSSERLFDFLIFVFAVELESNLTEPSNSLEDDELFNLPLDSTVLLTVLFDFVPVLLLSSSSASLSLSTLVVVVVATLLISLLVELGKRLLNLPNILENTLDTALDSIGGSTASRLHKNKTL